MKATCLAGAFVSLTFLRPVNTLAHASLGSIKIVNKTFSRNQEEL
jgi:hypothetical protein